MFLLKEKENKVSVFDKETKNIVTRISFSKIHTTISKGVNTESEQDRAKSIHFATYVFHELKTNMPKFYRNDVIIRSYDWQFSQLSLVSTLYSLTLNYLQATKGIFSEFV